MNPPMSTPKRLFGLSIALLVPAASIIISILLVSRGVNITKVVSDRFNGQPGELLGESTEKVSVFENKLEPILTTPTSIEIKAVGIRADLVPVNVDSDGVMETPKNWYQAGWFVQGGVPGENRNLIINGHYDTNTGAPAAFYNLQGVQFGDVIEVKDKYGRIFNYKVIELSYLDIKDPSRLDVLEDEDSKSTLTLITCGGVYLQGSGYDKRLVVRAELL